MREVNRPALPWYRVPTRSELLQDMALNRNNNRPGSWQADLPLSVLHHEVAERLHTTGSSSLPKLIPLTNARLTIASEPLASSPKLLITFPHHAYAVFTIASALSMGKHVFLNPSGKTPVTTDLLLSALRASFSNNHARGPEVLCGIPNFIDRLIHGTQAGEGMTLLHKFKAILLAGSPSSPGLVAEIEEHDLPVLHFVSSTETGPLMSNGPSVIQGPPQFHDWRWFREDVSCAAWLTFEPCDAGLSGKRQAYELVVREGYPSLSVTNRPDGGFDTKDLYVPHPAEAGKWKYLMRKDDVLMDVMGMTTNPKPSTPFTRP